MPAPLSPKTVAIRVAEQAHPERQAPAAADTQQHGAQALQLQRRARLADLPLDLLPLQFLTLPDITNLAQIDTRTWEGRIFANVEQPVQAAVLAAEGELHRIISARKNAPAEAQQALAEQQVAAERQVKRAHGVHDLQEAMRRVASSLAETPNDPELWEQAAAQLLLCGRYEEAAHAWELCIAFSPFSQDAYKNLCAATNLAGKPQVTLDIFQKMREALDATDQRAPDGNASDDDGDYVDSTAVIEINFSEQINEARLLSGRQDDLEAVVANIANGRARPHHRVAARFMTGQQPDLGRMHRENLMPGLLFYVQDAAGAQRAIDMLARDAAQGAPLQEMQREFETLVLDPLVRASPAFPTIARSAAWKAIEDTVGVYPEFAQIDVRMPFEAGDQARATGGRAVLDFASIPDQDWHDEWR